MSQSDLQLLQACLAGDERAWSELIDRYGRLVYSVPRRYGLSETDADDVFAAVWALAFRKLHQLRDQARLSSWLITTAHRESWRIGKRGESAVSIDEQVASPDAPSESQMETWETQHIVRQSLDELGGPCKELLTALFLESEAPRYDAIAQKLGIPIGSIGPTRARCFKKLQSILVEHGWDDLPRTMMAEGRKP